MVADACRHQADKNVESWAIDHPAFGRCPELVPWSRQLAEAISTFVMQRFEFEATVEQATWEVRFVAGRPRTRSAAEILRDERDKATNRVGMFR